MEEKPYFRIGYLRLFFSVHTRISMPIKIIHVFLNKDIFGYLYFFYYNYTIMNFLSQRIYITTQTFFDDSLMS